MDGKFTAAAEAVWDAIPPLIRERILQNVWCSQCKKVTTIAGVTGQMEGGSLVLEGQCIECGHAVARLLEGEN